MKDKKRKDREGEGKEHNVPQISAKKMKTEKEVTEVFADPTYDATFKMLFGRDSNTDLTISFLNSILGFSGTEDEIRDLTIINSELIQEDVTAIESVIDVRCTTVNDKEIAIEMQRRNEDYFLSRTQDYMAKLISSQVKRDEGNKYHISMHKTYMVIISKAKLFLKDKKIEGDHGKMYEKTVVPMIRELGQEIPDNKMYWKFFELQKFKSFAKNKTIDVSNLLKEQWLDFLLNCGAQNDIPENISEIIKRGYEIMKIAKWTEVDKQNYELAKLKEAYKVEEDKNIYEKGVLQGVLQEEIKQLKMLKKMEADGMQISDEYYNQIQHKDQIINYFNTHPNYAEETESQILGNLGLLDME